MGRWFKNATVNGNFSNGITGWSTMGATVSAANNVAAVTGTGTFAFSLIKRNTDIVAMPDKKIFVRFLGKVTNPDCLKMRINIDGSTGGTEVNIVEVTPTMNVQGAVSAVATIGDLTGNVQILLMHRYANTNTAIGKVMEVKEVIVYDITALPAEQQTAEWCEANIVPFIIW